MKKIFTLLVAALAFVGVHAAEKTIWEGTYSDGIEIASETISTFKAGDVLRVYVTVPEGGANFKIVYKGEANGWSETAIPSIDTQWPWVNGDETYKEFALTQNDLTVMAGMNIYIYKGEQSVVTKVTLITADETPVAQGERTVWEGNEAISWNNEVAPGTQLETPDGIFAGLAKDDIIKLYTTTTYDEPQYVVTYKKGDSWEWTDLQTTISDGVISYTVADATIAQEIADRGLVIRGQAFNLTKITVSKPGDATMISQHKVQTAAGKVYNLRGMEVKGQLNKGIYVKNGKKIVIR